MTSPLTSKVAQGNFSEHRSAEFQTSPKEDPISIIQKFARERLSKEHIAERLYPLNQAAFIHATDTFLEWSTEQEDRIQIAKQLFNSILSQRQKRITIPENFSYELPKSDRKNKIMKWIPIPSTIVLHNPVGIQILVETKIQFIGGYKHFVKHQSLSFKESSIYPFSEFNTSFVATLKELDRYKGVVSESINLHSHLFKKLKAVPQDNVHLPIPPLALFTSNNLITYLQPFYGDFLLNLEKKDLTHKECLNILFHVGNTLLWMHQKGYLHADIKLDNILLDNQLDPSENSGRFIGLLNDFDLSTKNWGRSTEISFNIDKIFKKLKCIYVPPCNLFSITSPLNDLCNFALTACLALCSISPTESIEIRNKIIRSFLMNEQEVPTLIPESDENLPVENLNIYFRNALQGLYYENMRLLSLLVKDGIAELNKTDKQKLKDWHSTELLRLVVQNIPVDKYSHDAVRAAFKEIQTPYTLENMLAKIKSTLEEMG